MIPSCKLPAKDRRNNHFSRAHSILSLFFEAFGCPCHIVCLSSAPFLSLPGNEGVLATKKAHPAAVHCVLHMSRFVLKVSDVSPERKKRVHGNKKRWLFFLLLCFLTFICIHAQNGLNQYWYGPAGCSAHHIGRVNIATVIRKKQKDRPASMTWGESNRAAEPKNSH